MLRKALPLFLFLALPAFALAETVPSAAGPQQPRTVVTVPLQDLPHSPSFGERAERFWFDLLGRLGLSSFGSDHFVRSHNMLNRQQAQMRDDFTWLMDIAGYKLKEIESSVGLIPSLSLTFGHARELTEADREYVERSLTRHARNHPGPLAAMQRAIVRSILDASEIGHFAVEKVQVDLFPLPKVTFALAPIDPPLSPEASRIMRAIDRMNARLQSMAPHPQGFERLPSTPPGIQPAAAPAAILH